MLEKDRHGHSALLDACRNGHDNVIQLLRNAGADLQKLYPGREGIADLAITMNSAVHKLQYEFLQRMLECGAPPSVGDYNMRTPLHIAAMESNPQARIQCLSIINVAV